MSRPLVVLVGPPGAGKTSVGRLVADRLGVPFRDTDADVEAQAGRSVADIFVESGEETFRALEKQAVARALAEHTGVLAVGAGAVSDREVRAALRGQRVILLAAGAPTVVERTGLTRARPVALGTPRRLLTEALAQRYPLYHEIASAEVATDDRTIEQVADELEEMLR